MFQRLREAIDSRIAEEQARQKAAQDSISRSNSNRRPAATRNLSPGGSRLPSRPRRNTGTPIRGPDPNDFDPEFVIGDDEGSTRSITPHLEAGDSSNATENIGDGNSITDEFANSKDATISTGEAAVANTVKAADANSNHFPSESPTEVRAKLRRLDKLESKYNELLRAYRVAHARVLSIEPFEAALRENTPLASIGDSNAFTEYLGQVALKGDMVQEELKRVTTERDDCKKKLDDARASAKAAWDEVTSLKKTAAEESQLDEPKHGKEKADDLSVDTDVTKEASAASSAKSPTSSATSRTSRIPGISIFSPKLTAAKPPSPLQRESEEFFSFDNEIPRLETELKQKEDEVGTLKSQVEKLKRDLSVARESTEGMVQNLESATRELAELRDKREELEGGRTKLEEAEAVIEKKNLEIQDLTTQLKSKSDELDQLRTQHDGGRAGSGTGLSAELEMAQKLKEANEKRLGVLEGLVTNLRSQLKDAEASVAGLKKEVSEKAANIAKLERIVNFVDGNLQDNDAWRSTKEKVLDGQGADFHEILNNLVLSKMPKPAKQLINEESVIHGTINNSTEGGNSGKKKKNKKKKGGKGAVDTTHASSTGASEYTQLNKPKNSETVTIEENVSELEQKIESLAAQLREKEVAIDHLSAKLKGEEDLRDEVDTLRDELLSLGQEHVEARDKIKQLTAEKESLEETISKFEQIERELLKLRASHAYYSADSEKQYDDLKSQVESLKTNAKSLETNLSAAQELAASRFKELTELKATLQRIQPELRTLRAESAELKTVKETVASKTAELRDLENKHEKLRSELETLRSTISRRDAEVASLTQTVRQETGSRLKAEEALAVARSDLKYSESKKQESIEAKEKAAVELLKTQEELKTAGNKLREMEEQVAQLTNDLSGLREEIELKTAQHASAQSLMNSMRDQTTEMATQVKEAHDRCEGLEEELADAHRLLSERTREGETMRRLLNDVEGRTEATIRKYKERMEAAIEERDRAEDEASSFGRRRTREMEELKAQIREVERALRSAEQDKEELEHSQKDWKRRRDELETQSENSAQEIREVRHAMTQLRGSLDEAEKHVRELEKERSELRRSIEESNTRLEKLRKTNKTFSDEVRSLQQQNSNASKTRGNDSEVQSSRTSLDSSSRKGFGSPVSVARDRNAPVRRNETPAGAGTVPIDHIYLKNVLLQFLEHKDKNYQKQLIPVLAMLLRFDRNDEQRWMAAITSG